MRDYELFLPRNPESPSPFVLILPILGRFLFLPDFWIEKDIARFFAKRGFAAAVIQRDFFSFTPGKGLNQINEYMENTVELASKTIREITGRADIDKTRLFSLGISFGGMINVLLSARDKTIKKSVVALAGGNIPEILGSSRDPLVKSYYQTVLRGTRLVPAEFISRLQKELKQEPLRFAPLIDKENVLMVNAKYDKVVRPEYSEALRKALGFPETVYLPTGHYLALLLLPYLKRRALKFFQSETV